MTHANKLKGQFDYNTKQVLWLTDMTDMEYQNFQIDTAKAWIDRYWADVYEGDTLIGSSLFWKWWAYAWHHADDTVILPILYATPPNGRHSSYRAMHQYIFNQANEDQQWLMQDFKNLRPEFEKEIKTASSPLSFGEGRGEVKTTNP